jgi:HSP20 family protein
MNDCSEYGDIIMPCMYMNHDTEKYYAQVELPGVKKEDIELEVMENGLCIRGMKGEKEISGCWMLGHMVKVDDVKATYKEGLLDIVMPMKNPLKGGKKIDIQ